MKKFSLFITLVVLQGLTTLASTGTPQFSKAERELMTASETGDLSKLKKLLKDSRLNLNVQDEEKMTPLMLAALTGQDVVAKALLATNKIQMELANEVGDTALAVALGNEQYEVARVLVAEGAKVDITVNGYDGITPFMMAIENDLTLAKSILKKNKSTLDKQDPNGNSALLRSIMKEDIPAIQMLLSVGAEKSLKNNLGLTALDLAKKSANKKLQQLLK